MHTEEAQLADIDELSGLYWSVYGEDYPLEIGTNKTLMRRALQSPNEYFWLVMRQNEHIIGSCIVEIDTHARIGKISGVAVHPNWRGKKIATTLVAQAVQKILRDEKRVHSLYSTTRTVSVSSQMMLLHNGLRPLGIFPNARKIKSYETLTLMGIFNEGVLQKRAPISRLPSSVANLLEIVETSLGAIPTRPETYDFVSSNNEEILSEEKFEFIYATDFVEKRSKEVFRNDADATFYPFHKPNLLIHAVNSQLELYACFSKKDHYCVLIGANRPIIEMSKHFKKMLFDLKEIGVYYIEVLVRADSLENMNFFLEQSFISSAFYPAMREVDGQMHDYVLMTRNMVPLDFSELSVESSFMPYVKHYTHQWIQKHLERFAGV
jgi:RimJ/RimL family protein N-acetyltransferase